MPATPQIRSRLSASRPKAMNTVSWTTWNADSRSGSPPRATAPAAHTAGSAVRPRGAKSPRSPAARGVGERAHVDPRRVHPEPGDHARVLHGRARDQAGAREVEEPVGPGEGGERDPDHEDVVVGEAIAADREEAERRGDALGRRPEDQG